MDEDFKDYTDDVEIYFDPDVDNDSLLAENKTNIANTTPPWNELLWNRSITGNALTLGGATAFAAGVVGLNYAFSSKLKEREEKRKRFQYVGK